MRPAPPTAQANTVGLGNGQRVYAQADLIREAKRRGFEVSQGLVEKWVGLGLLDQGTRRGKGKGRGATFFWPESQLQLFLLLLEKRSAVTRVRVLANLPVAIWMYWGEDYVPLRQVRRAMETWADVGRARARHDWDGMARKIVHSIADPSSTRSERVLAADVLAEYVRTRSTERDDLETVLRPIVGPSNPTAFTDAPRVAELMVAQVEAIKHIQEFPDAIFRWARAFLLVAQGDYVRSQPQLATDPRFGSLHERPSFEDFVTGACHDLTVALGLYMARPSGPALPQPLDPTLWEAGRARMTVTANYEPSPLTLPPGVDGGRIRVDAHIEVDPDT